MTDRLWAPWRIGYISNAIARKAGKGCLFCRAKRAPKANHVFLMREHSFALLNIFPYNNGHVMVCPKRHIRSLADLNAREQLDLIRTVNDTKGLLDRTIRPHGYNIGINMGDIAGAGIKNHLHVHLVPRWKGDTNFMPVLAGTKVISQSLEELHRLLCAAAKKQRL